MIRMKVGVILLVGLVVLIVILFCLGSREKFMADELRNARLLSFGLSKSKEAVSSNCDIPVPSGYIRGPLKFNLEKQQGQGWAVYLVELPFNIRGRQMIFKALLDTGSDHLVLLGEECACSKVYHLYPAIGRTAPVSCDVTNKYGDGTEYRSGRKEGILDIYSGVKFSFNYVKKLLKKSITGSQVYPICGLSTGRSPNFIEQMFKSFAASVPKTFEIDFPSRRFSIGEPMNSDVTVPIATKSEYQSLGLPYLFFYMVSPKEITYQDSKGTWKSLSIKYVIPDTGSVSFAVGPSFMKHLDIKAIKVTFEDTQTGREFSIGGPVQPGQATPLIEHDNVLLIPVGFLDKYALSFDLEDMTFGLST